MNTSSQMNAQDVARVKLEVLKRQHGDLNTAIDAIHQTGHPDALQLQRLKRQKLDLKDQMVRLHNLITPDIIA